MESDDHIRMHGCIDSFAGTIWFRVLAERGKIQLMAKLEDMAGFMRYHGSEALRTFLFLILIVGALASCESDPPCPCDRDARNCEDFSSEESAQRCFEKCFDEAGDIHRLDADSDGLACEGLD